VVGVAHAFQHCSKMEKCGGKIIGEEEKDRRGLRFTKRSNEP
jgi:hypothetical protein